MCLISPCFCRPIRALRPGSSRGKGHADKYTEAQPSHFENVFKGLSKNSRRYLIIFFFHNALQQSVLLSCYSRPWKVSVRQTPPHEMHDATAPLYNGAELEIDQVTDGVTVRIRCGRTALKLRSLTLVTQSLIKTAPSSLVPTRRPCCNLIHPM